MSHHHCVPIGYPIALALAVGLTILGGCRTHDVDVHTVGVPWPLESLSVTSDARLDASHRLLGSFVGEGTGRAIHLLSNDTSFIAALYRRYGPPLTRGEQVWSRLQQAGTVALHLSDGRTGPFVQEALAGSADGLVPVEPAAVLLHGDPCGPLGARAEILVGESQDSTTPPVFGPVLGSFQTRPRSELANDEMASRRPATMPGQELTASLIARTERVFEEALATRLASDRLPLDPPGDRYLEINTLADIDAADVVPFRGDTGGTQYVVALRVQRVTARADTILIAGVMTWDSAGLAGRMMLRPTVLRVHGRRVAAEAGWTPMYWRRVAAIAGFASRGDYLWLEQVHPSEQAVLWGVVAPATNTPVAAARVTGACTEPGLAAKEGSPSQ